MSAAAAQTTNNKAEISLSSEIINLEAFADMLTDCVIMSKLDLGQALVYKVKHPVRGDMVLINTSGDKNAVVYM